MDIPEITSVQRFTLAPNERIIFHTDQGLTREQAQWIKEQAAHMLDIPPSRVFVLDKGWTIQTIAVEDAA